MILFVIPRIYYATRKDLRIITKTSYILKLLHIGNRCIARTARKLSFLIVVNVFVFLLKILIPFVLGATFLTVNLSNCIILVAPVVP